jgi:protease-3
MKFNKTQCLIALALSGVLLTACHQQTLKPAATAVNTTETINNAVIRKSPNDDRVYAAILLPNQLQVVLVSDPTLENAAAALAVGVGSAQNPESQPGLAHYLEHMLFLGTEKYPIPDSFMEFVQANAGFTNAFTAYDKTNFHFQINAEKFDEALDRFSDYFKAPTLDAKFSDKERNAVNSEWSMNRAQDNWILDRVDSQIINPANPHAKFSIGNLETLSDKKDSKLQDEVKAFYNRYYSANNMRAALIGKQSIDELKAMAEKYFAAIPNKNIPLPDVTVPGLTQAEMGKVIRYQSLKDWKKIFIDFPIKNNKEQWRVKPNEYVISLLTSEEKGTLCEQLRTAGFANNVTAFVAPDEYGNDGYLRIEADLTDMGLTNTDQIIASVFAYVDMVKKAGASEQYFRELKMMRDKDFVNAPKPDPFKQVVGLAMSQFELPVEHVMDSEYVYENFDPKAIASVLDELDSDKARVWHISKSEVADKSIAYFEGKYSIRDISREEKSRWSGLAKNLTFNLPPLNTLFTDKPAPIVDNVYLKPHQVVSQPGIEIFLTHPQFYREDKGLLTVELNVPFARASAKNMVLASLLSDVYKNQNTTLIDRAGRASLGIEIGVSATSSQLINISGYTTKHEELLSQLLTGFSGLQVSNKDFVEAVDRYKQARINAAKAPPFRQAFGQVKRLLSDAKWSDAELLAVAKRVTVKDLVAYHQSVKADPLLRVYAFGNYTEAAIKQMAVDAMQQLPAKRLPQQRALAKFMTPKNGQNIRFADKVDLADSALVDMYIGEKKSVDEYAQLIVLNSIFHNVFFSQLRTNEQLGYVVGSAPVPFDEHAAFALYVQSANTDLPGIKQRMDKFRKEFLAVLQATDSAQIEQSKTAELANILQKPTDFNEESGLYSSDFWAGHYNFDDRARLVAALKNVNKASVVALYQKMLLTKQSVNMLVQLKGTAFANKPYAKP